MWLLECGILDPLHGLRGETVNTHLELQITAFLDTLVNGSLLDDHGNHNDDSLMEIRECVLSQRGRAALRARAEEAQRLLSMVRAERMKL